MRPLNRALRSAQLTTILGAFASALAAAAPSAADLERCTDIADPTARLACYDAISGYTADRKPTAASPPVPARNFGFTEAQRAPVQLRDEPTAIQAHIARINESRWGPASAVLDNGQTWVFVDDEQDANLKPQDPITIKRGAVGSFLLVTSSHHSYHVRRTQ